jgi:type 2 lantibiotic biosynthesis protein LanM
MNFEQLLVRASTMDELLSEDFETLPGQKGDTELAAKRLAAWCRASASGDWALFAKRLERDELSFEQVLGRLATVRRREHAPRPLWLSDAQWIEAAFRSSPTQGLSLANTSGGSDPYAFEHLFLPVIDAAEKRLWPDLDGQVAANLSSEARTCLRRMLLAQLSELCAPALYDRFVASMKASAEQAVPDGQNKVPGTTRYARFIADMREAGLQRLFEEKPVLLRLIATVTRQWITTTREIVLRLDADLPAIRRDILRGEDHGRIAKIEGELSDPHNGGRSVLMIAFEDGTRVVYKPKDVRLDASWHALVERLNHANPPIDLKAVRTLSRDGYGWTEFIQHGECTGQEDFGRFFRRAGAWLALFHAFAGTDMHEENMIADGDQPVPIDLEMILQASVPEPETQAPEARALQLAEKRVGESVMMIGLLPAYARSPDNQVYGVGGLNNQQRGGMRLQWENVNSDEMRGSRMQTTEDPLPNMPRFRGEHAKLGDHVGDLLAGFETYAAFLSRSRGAKGEDSLFHGFAGLPVRKVIKPTRFYYLLMQRLKDHRAMDDGATWSAQADFVSRLADWSRDEDPIWPLQRAERAALLELNVPHFVSPSDAEEVQCADGTLVRARAIPGIDRARARFERLDDKEIAWQAEVIRQSTSTVSGSAGRPVAAGKALSHLEAPVAPDPGAFLAEAEKIVATLSDLAIRSGPGAAWVGLDWLGDSEVCQLVALGPDLYNGTSGIAVFLAAHARLTGSEASADLARAGISGFCQSLRSANAARMARSLGIGGASGLGSIVYALSVLAEFLDQEALLDDAHVAARLFSNDLIAADRQLDVIGGSAGAILGLLRLHRASGARDVLDRATRCGEHLLGQPRVGAAGHRSWCSQGAGPRPLNGMSHGAAGFAHALGMLAAATGREDFAEAARECIAFENASFDPSRSNWPDLRGEGAEMHWTCQWCHGATGIGLARAASLNRKCLDPATLKADVERALAGNDQGWPNIVDTLCCGALGNVEFLNEAGNVLQMKELSDLASRRLFAVVESATSSGDYRWSAGGRQFNLGFFRGLAGVGYTLLRRVDARLPNVLVWE